MKAFLKHLWGELELAILGVLFGAFLMLPLLAITSLVGCNSVQSVGVTAGYGNDIVTVGVTIVFKEAPSAETVAALEAANAVRIKSSPEVWALGRYRIDNKSQVKAVDAAIKDGATIERIE